MRPSYKERIIRAVPDTNNEALTEKILPFIDAWLGMQGADGV